MTVSGKWLVCLIMLVAACSPHIHLDVLGEPGLKEVVVLESKQKQKVLLIGLSGTIQTSRDPGFGRRRGDSVTGIHARLKLAARDPNVKGVILKLDTPGGEGTASDIIYHEILTFKEKTGLPVVALMMGMATSGGYYVAAACDHIMAHPTTITGSIGVIGILPNFKEGLDRIGVKIEIVKSGDMKDAGEVTASWFGKNDDGEDVANGVYLCHIKVNDGSHAASEVIKIAVVRKD